MLKLMSPTTRQYLLIALLLSLISCTNEPLALPAETPSQKVVSPTPIITLTPIPATEFSTRLPTQPTIAFITPDAIQIERWREYEDELAKLVLSNSGAEYPRYEDALCEWDVLGRSGQDIYVWAECSAPGSGGRGPAVIYLEEDGSIRDVIYAFPSPTRDVIISKLFPEDIQAKIYTYFSSELPRELQRHLTYRLTHPDVPPLIILSGMPISSTTPLPPQPTIAFITPDTIQVERWKEYEDALSIKLLPPNSLRGEVLCEWELLGRSDQSIFVWAFCQSPPYTEDLPPSVASMPAVIHFGKDGTIQRVEVPGSGTAYARDVREMFPPDVQEIIFRHSIDTEKMKAHIDFRRENPSPPLIVLSAMPTSSTTPLPPQPIIAVITPDSVQVERWKEYEKSLARAFFSYLPPEEVLCEWDFLGRSAQEIYLWGVCMSINPIGTTTSGRDIFSSSSTPAVLHLGENGSVQRVEIPGAGSFYAPDIHQMFPPDVQEKFDQYPSGRAAEMSKHIEWRRTHPEEPPLIVLSAATVTPTPTP